jgi:hypothetical protein
MRVRPERRGIRGSDARSLEDVTLDNLHHLFGQRVLEDHGYRVEESGGYGLRQEKRKMWDWGD